jgi:hypothetical protein
MVTKSNAEAQTSAWYWLYTPATQSSTLFFRRKAVAFVDFRVDGWAVSRLADVWSCRFFPSAEEARDYAEKEIPDLYRLAQLAATSS